MTGMLRRLLASRRTPPAPPKWCWRAALAEHSCACQAGCVLPPEERGDGK